MKKSILGVTILSAVAASLCCITPVLAVLAGSASLASAFSWLAPARPYLIGITVIVLAIAWYQHLSRKIRLRKVSSVHGGDALSAETDAACCPPVTDCCTDGEKQSFWKSTTFLLMITLFAFLALGFPYYGGNLLKSRVAKSSAKPEMLSATGMDSSVQAILQIPSMDCEACARAIRYMIMQVPGVVNARVSYPDKKAWVIFNPRLTNVRQIDSAVQTTGYPVAQWEMVQR
ncbi:MAG: cation transporter [Thermoflavifilum sp.]|nr:cation transporter [Thermoflavifilum sp.]